MPLPTIKAFGFEIPLSKFGVYALSVVVVIASIVYAYQKLYNDPERVILSLKEVNEQMAATVEEYSRHVMEEPTKHELFEDEDGALAIRVYRDHCVLIQRKSRNGTQTRLVIDLARQDLRSENQITPEQGWSLLPVLHAEGQPSSCKRGCLNPHPGPFQWWYGAQRGEWVEVWRRWPEGCSHYQLFNPRRNIWDSNPDGTPKIQWSCCVH